MKIVLTGGGSGGHFYPIIAVAQEIHNITSDDKLLEPELFYIGPEEYDRNALMENNIVFRQSPAGKVRRYFSVLNFFDFFKNIIGIIKAIVQLFIIYPDVVFSKGGYAAFPTVVAARVLMIPVIVHESDATPGMVNRWAAKFAHRVAVSYPGVAKEFKNTPEEKIALTGNPVRSTIFSVAKEGGYEYLGLSPEVPTILILGGSQGAQKINEAVISALPTLVQKYQIIHQVGKKNIEEIKGLAGVVLHDIPYAERYHPFGFLNTLAYRMSAGISSLVIGRAGSGTIFDTAAWGLPSIMIPLPEDVSHDQTTNAFAYARSGAAVVIKQKNLTEHLIIAEIERIMGSEEVQNQMKKAASDFARPDAAHKIAQIIIETALEHE